MKIKINRDEVSILTKKLDEYTLDLYKNVKGCIFDLENLKNGYRSPEGEYAIEASEEYFDNLNTIPFTLNEINKAIKKANNGYEEQDEEFTNEYRKEVEEEVRINE